jgi:hypothetical protein
MNVAVLNEEIYSKYAKLREIATSVYADKIEEKTHNGELSFEGLCNAILYGFDDENKTKIANQLNISKNELIIHLVCLSNGARLENQNR